MYNYNDWNKKNELQGWSQNQPKSQPRPPQSQPKPPTTAPQSNFGTTGFNQPAKPSFGYLAAPPNNNFQPQLKYSKAPAGGNDGGPPKKKSSYGPIPRATQSPVHKRRKLKKYLLLVFLGVFVLTAIAAGVFVGAGDSLLGNSNDENNAGEGDEGEENNVPGANPTNPPTNPPPTTPPPTNPPPTTPPPTTPPPTTPPPTTPPPTTPPPTTPPPTTPPPTTPPPTTPPPTTPPPTTPPPTDPGPIQVFPAETRNGNNYVGIMFLNPPNQATEDAFLGAADRWSSILAGSENLMENRVLNANSETCNGNGNRIDTTIALDHLRITADVVFIDGNFGTVGRAGPCRFTSNAIPTFGNMEFDSADIDRMAREGSLESVILHEMGHVLGIGTLWNFFRLSQNELAGSQPNLNAIQPTYVGANGVAEYRLLTGRNVNTILIENGFTNGASNGAGPGSVNGHWDQDDMGVELMTFRIQVRTPALSAVTIRALADFGYTVDATQADFFSNPVNFVVNPDEVLNEELIGDIIDPTEFLNEIDA